MCNVRLLYLRWGSRQQKYWKNQKMSWPLKKEKISQGWLGKEKKVKIPKKLKKCGKHLDLKKTTGFKYQTQKKWRNHKMSQS